MAAAEYQAALPKPKAAPKGRGKGKGKKAAEAEQPAEPADANTPYTRAQLEAVFEQLDGKYSGSKKELVDWFLRVNARNLLGFLRSDGVPMKGMLGKCMDGRRSVNGRARPWQLQSDILTLNFDITEDSAEMSELELESATFLTQQRTPLPEDLKVCRNVKMCPAIWEALKGVAATAVPAKGGAGPSTKKAAVEEAVPPSVMLGMEPYAPRTPNKRKAPAPSTSVTATTASPKPKRAKRLTQQDVIAWVKQQQQITTLAEVNSACREQMEQMERAKKLEKEQEGARLMRKLAELGLAPAALAALAQADAEQADAEPADAEPADAEPAEADDEETEDEHEDA